MAGNLKNNWPGCSPYLAGYWAAAWGHKCQPQINDEDYKAEYERGYRDYESRSEKRN